MSPSFFLCFCSLVSFPSLTLLQFILLFSIISSSVFSFLLRGSSDQYSADQYEISWLIESHSHSSTLYLWVCLYDGVCACVCVCAFTFVFVTVLLCFVCEFILVQDRVGFCQCVCVCVCLCVLVTKQVSRPGAVSLILFLWGNRDAADNSVVWATVLPGLVFQWSFN